MFCAPFSVCLHCGACFSLRPYVKPLDNAVETVSLFVHVVTTSLLGSATFPLPPTQQAGFGVLVFIPAISFAVYLVATALQRAFVPPSVTAQAGQGDKPLSSTELSAL
jgi:hypothetical protein